MKPFKLISKILFSLIFFIIVFSAFIAVTNGFKISHTQFHHNIKRILNKAEVLAVKAENFDENQILAELGSNPFNNFYYRFDENLAAARSSGLATKTDDGHTKGSDMGFEFNHLDEVTIRPVNGKYSLVNGILKYTYEEQNYLENVTPLNIDKETVGDIEIRMKLKHARKLLFIWRSDFSAQFSKLMKTDLLSIWTIPDNRFHTYRVNVQQMLWGAQESKEPIRKIFIYPNEVGHDDIEIDYIRFISKKKKYFKKPYGITYEKIAQELRKAIYVHPSLSLKYTLKIPDGHSVLKFGMGAMEDKAILKFNISIQNKKSKTVLFSKQITNGLIWHDAVVDLSRFANQNIDISFTTTGNSIGFWSNPVLYAPPKEKFNIIIVLEDALRADHLSSYGYFRQTTPVKDKWAQSGIVFKNAFSQATYTRASCASFLTSLYPSAAGVWDFSESLDESYLTLAEILRNQGFETALFAQNAMVGPSSGLHQGFGTVLDYEKIGFQAHQLYGSTVLDQWFENNRDRNFFLYLHLIDPHAPYDPPDEGNVKYRSDYIGGKIRVQKDSQYDPDWLEKPTVESRNFLYDQEIRYNDYFFERFLDSLKKYKLYEDSIVIFISDHGEYLGEHDLWGHTPPGYIQVLHVPMIMVYPKILPKNHVIHQPVQLLDLMPTILDLAGINKDGFIIEGDSLLSLIHNKKPDFWRNRFCISEEVRSKFRTNKKAHGSIFYRQFHILHTNKLQQKGLFNGKLFKTRVFDSSMDKDEYIGVNRFIIDFYFTHKVHRFIQQLQDKHLNIWGKIVNKRANTIVYNPETMERLRSLGYIQ